MMGPSFMPMSVWHLRPVVTRAEIEEAAVLWCFGRDNVEIAAALRVRPSAVANALPSIRDAAKALRPRRSA